MAGAATVSLAAVFVGAPHVGMSAVVPVLTLGAISLVSHLMGYTIAPGESTGTVSFVPFLASAVLVAAWPSAVSVALVTLAVQIIRGRDVGKAVFNVSQHTVSVCLAILAFHLLGGWSLVGHARSGMPYLAIVGLFVTYKLLNSAAVSGAVALSDSRSFWGVWASNSLGTVLYDVLALPAVAALAWIDVRYGPAGAFAFAVPLLGLRELYKVYIELEKANQELLELMVAAIEARDPYTSGHSRRVSQNAKIIAQIVGLRQTDVRRVEIAALLHDVGKIHEVFAPILQKPGRLTDEENAIMQTHPIKSEELVARVSQLRDIVPAVRHHHENWDGTGYPDRLAGEKIPLASRIIMFADTIDAMTSDRPYRKALDADAVRQELVKWRGRQFDPAVCDSLLSSSRYAELFKHSPHQSLPHTQEIPRLRLAVDS